MSCHNILLLITVVRRGRGDTVVNLARSAGATGSTVLLGRGTATNKWLELLFLADTEKELVFTIAPKSTMRGIIDTLWRARDLCKKVPGIAFTIEVERLWRHAMPAPEEEKELCKMTESDRQLICVIANEGFSDDLMRAARAAGAKGGTIIHARGTGTLADSSFFGIAIVPEKEMLLVLAKNDDAPAIIQAMRACECLATPGAGILFCLPVTEFFQLGPGRSAS